jgi:hypothetical protein
MRCSKRPCTMSPPRRADRLATNQHAAQRRAIQASAGAPRSGSVSEGAQRPQLLSGLARPKPSIRSQEASLCPKTNGCRGSKNWPSDPGTRSLPRRSAKPGPYSIDERPAVVLLEILAQPRILLLGNSEKGVRVMTETPSTRAVCVA